jgi:hypothetical protein
MRQGKQPPSEGKIAMLKYSIANRVQGYAVALRTLIPKFL